MKLLKSTQIRNHETAYFQLVKYNRMKFQTGHSLRHSKSEKESQMDLKRMKKAHHGMDLFCSMVIYYNTAQYFNIAIPPRFLKQYIDNVMIGSVQSTFWNI
uniref:Uncharacterized protein n=1 Tax=Micrurus spixii TaxID=129469 RepID=A0A2D4LHP6_9SAUR